MKKFLSVLLSVLIVIGVFTINSSAANDTEVDLGQENGKAHLFF